MQQTSDIRPMWLKVTRSMQAQSCRQRGYAILSIRVVVDSDGNPMFWTSPELVKIEPMSSDALPALLESLAKST